MSFPDTGFSNHLLEEYATLEYILLGDLRDLLEEYPDESNRKWLFAVLDALLDTLPREFQLRCEGGYLAEVVEQYPNWMPQVEQLRDEHEMLYANLGELRSRIAARSPFSLIASEVRRDLMGWMRSMLAHHRHERRMVQTAFNLEVGTGD
jgi:hypothetical protein